jgi:biopolymer transport protein ExbB
MKMNIAKSIVLAGGVLLAASGAVAQDESARSLDELLGFVKQGQTSEAKENSAREARFRAAKADQAKMLQEAKDERTRQERRSAQLEKQFEDNEKRLAAAQKRLRDAMGSLQELFGHITSTAGDARSNFEGSLTSAQIQGREEYLSALVDKMSGGEQLPKIEEIEKVWYMLLQEMVESGRVVSFDATIEKPNGDKVESSVTRVGLFNIVSAEGNYLQFVPETGALSELARQPGVTGEAAALATATSVSPFFVDPTGATGGSFLAALINSPDLEERWHQGGYVGYVITAVGVVAMLIAIMRLIVLAGMSSKVKAQLKASSANTNNPLGRVLKVHEDNPKMDTETLELKLSEAILKETPAIEKNLTLLKIIAAVAPLLGLLGTVTGMIVTFQAITIFGAGDPKAMAGGISGALVTTVLGLIVAIPTVLMHTIVNGKAKEIIHILEEQTTGIIAEHTESSMKG